MSQQLNFLYMHVCVWVCVCVCSFWSFALITGNQVKQPAKRTNQLQALDTLRHIEFQNVS